MKIVDFGLYIVVYNFIIGVLVVIASEKLGIYAGHVAGAHSVRATRLTRVVTFTLGACIAILMIGVFVAGYVLKL